jgi:outer membrane protein TolC
MKDKLRILFISLALILVWPAIAQERKLLSLDEAINLSLKNSKQLKISRAQIEEANASLKESENRRLPDASVSASYLRLGTANVDIKKQNNNNGGSGGESPKVSQAAYGILNASLPIYAGGRIRYGIESSRYLAEAVKLDADNEKDAVVENTIEAYVNLYKARSAVDLVNENLAQAQQRVKDLSNLEKNGLLPRNDLLKAELQASNTELSLLDIENNWQLANVNMNLLLGLPEKTVLVPDSSLLEQTLTLKTLDDYVQSAIANRKDKAALALREQAAQAGVKAVRGEYYPSIQLTGGYIAANIPNVLTITNATNIGVGVAYNIGSIWKTKAKVQGAEARAKQLNANEELLNDKIRLEVNRAYLNLLSNQKKIEVYVKAIEQANENYRIVKNKYNNSLATTTDVLEADVAQLQARLNYTSARADAIIAYNQLQLVSGQEEQIIK